jgi:hypothetical protein
MKALGNKFQRQSASRVEEVVAAERELTRIEDGIRKLKVDFDIYFNGSNTERVKRPPLEARARLEASIKRISDNRTLSYAQRYHLNNLIARFTSYRELWRRMLRARGEDMV